MSTISKSRIATDPLDQRNSFGPFFATQSMNTLLCIFYISLRFNIEQYLTDSPLRTEGGIRGGGGVPPKEVFLPPSPVLLASLLLHW